jgi:hypothetical protein
METTLLSILVPLGYVFMFIVGARWAYRHNDDPFKRDPVDNPHAPLGVCFVIGLCWPIAILIPAGYRFSKLFEKIISMPNRSERHELEEKGLKQLRRPS